MSLVLYAAFCLSASLLMGGLFTPEGNEAETRAISKKEQQRYFDELAAKSKKQQQQQ